MNRLFQGFRVFTFAFGLTPLVSVSCQLNGPPSAETHQQMGTVQLSLTGLGSSGVEYRLRHATFDISGASEVSFSSEDYLTTPTVQLGLRTGAYAIELARGWVLERTTAAGIQAVESTLVSSNPVAFNIENRKTSAVSFRFQTADGVVNVGQGTLEVSIEVVEPELTLEPGIAMLVGGPQNHGFAYLSSGDLNGDGWPDIAIAHFLGPGGVVLNQQQETFGPEERFSESWWSNAATSVTLADLDLDGALDYVFGVYGDDYTGMDIQIYKGDGNGNRAIPALIPNGIVHSLSGANPMANRVADFDHNGLPDIATGSNNGEQTVDIILQTNPWVFAPTYAYNQDFNANAQWIEIGDFNHDGWMDLLVPFLYGPVEVYLNTANGTGAMTYAGGYFSARHHEVTVADFNADGYQDFAVRSENEPIVSVIYNDGNAAFSGAASFAVSGTSGTIRSGDINGDGLSDLVVCSPSASTVDVLLNAGDGSFQATIPIVLEEPALTTALDDFDHDGDLDVAVYTSTANASEHLRILWNRRR